MAENYKLVSEDEWQAMVDRAEVAEGWSEHWKERAERAEKSKRQLATLLDEKADREEAVKIPGSDNPTRPRNGEKNWLWRYDVDGNLIWSGPPELAPAFWDEPPIGDPLDMWRDYGKLYDSADSGSRTVTGRVESRSAGEPFPPSGFEDLSEAREAGPQRPHESLVWAIFAVASEFMREARGFSHYSDEVERDADATLARWRARWPESE